MAYRCKHCKGKSKKGWGLYKWFDGFYHNQCIIECMRIGKLPEGHPDKK